MSQILSQPNQSVLVKILSADIIPSEIILCPNKPSEIVSVSNHRVQSVCLNCPDVPCMKFNRSEIDQGIIPGFPSDDLLIVCPTNAMILGENGQIDINNENCILCGACASRCQIGAIYFDHTTGFKVNTINDVGYTSVTIPAIEFFAWRDETFRGCKKRGLYILENDSIVREFTTRFNRHRYSMGDRLPNLLSRNLLLAHRFVAAMSRRGNNFMRMDIVFSTLDAGHGVAEVEFGQTANLDAPRDILDSLSVVVSRYGWLLESTIPLIITDELPNRRSEYWSIMQDIKNVVEIEVYTITVFLLTLLLWNNKLLSLPNPTLYVDRETCSYRIEVIEKILGRPLQCEITANSLIDICK